MTLLLVIAFNSGFAQTLVGKWDMDVRDLRSSGLTSTTMELTPSGIVKTTSVFVIESNGVSISFYLNMSGKYEVSGKALCREMDPESIKYTWDFKCPSCDSKRLQQLRNDLGPQMREFLEGLTKETKLEWKSRGAYQQILQLNEETLAIQVPGGSLEVYQRIVE